MQWYRANTVSMLIRKSSPFWLYILADLVYLGDMDLCRSSEEGHPYQTLVQRAGSLEVSGKGKASCEYTSCSSKNRVVAPSSSTLARGFGGSPCPGHTYSRYIIFNVEQFKSSIV